MNITDILFQLQTGKLLQVFFIITAFLFMVFSCLGWVLELFFRRFVSAKKWINPGFLKGPYLPIYGIGVVTMSLYIFLLSALSELFPSKTVFHLTVIIGIGILMTFIELIGGLIFIRKMHIRLWDYSSCFGNYKGIICPQFSLIWTILGGLFYYFLFHRIVLLIIKFVSLDWFLIAVFLVGIFYGVFLMDFFQSLEVANKLKCLTDEQQLVLRWESFKLHIKSELEQKQISRPPFLSPFKSPILLREHLKTYIAEQGEKLEDFYHKEIKPRKGADEKHEKLSK